MQSRLSFRFVLKLCFFFYLFRLSKIIKINIRQVYYVYQLWKAGEKRCDLVLQCWQRGFFSLSVLCKRCCSRKKILRYNFLWLVRRISAIDMVYWSMSMLLAVIFLLIVLRVYGIRTEETIEVCAYISSSIQIKQMSHWEHLPWELRSLLFDILDECVKYRWIRRKCLIDIYLVRNI